MNESIKKICRNVLPWGFYRFLSSIYHYPENIHREEKLAKLKDEIILFLENETDQEKAEVLSFLKNNDLAMIPYQFIFEYRPEDVQLLFDNNMPYVFYEGKKLFFDRTAHTNAIKSYHISLLIEQDYRSPHCYSCKQNFIPKKGDVIADIGAAEGIWALKYIEICRKAYLFECDEKWTKALECTFAPWKNKIEIVNKFVGNEDKKDVITLDSFFKGEKVDVIKADIEGAELDMLDGASVTMREKVSRVALCSYHNQADEAEIKVRLSNYGFTEMDTSDGYITLPDLNLSSPYLRRGLVFASAERREKQP